MNVVENAFLPPGVCFICEEAPAGTEVVDTNRTWDPGAPTKLDGRKYLCGNCVRSAGEQIGLTSDDALKAAQAAQVAAENRLAVVRDYVNDFATKLSDSALGEVAAKAVVPEAPAPKKAPKKASGSAGA